MSRSPCLWLVLLSGLLAACGDDASGPTSNFDALGRCVSDNPCDCGFEDCDGDGACEADLTSEAHCGACDNACPAFTYCGADATCRCAAGYRDVDGECIPASEAIEPPVITQQPMNAEAEIGGEATFEVTATGEDLHYTWFQIDDLGGEQEWFSGSATLTVASIGRWSGGTYFVRVSNPGGSVDSNHVRLRVLPQALCTVEDLEELRNDGGGEYRLTCDIDLADVSFEPIEWFGGTLDGQGHTISGFVYDGTGGETQVGLFRSLSGEVRNLTLENFDLRGDSAVGALAGNSQGWVSDCIAKDVRIESADSAGGLFGTAHSGALVHSRASGTVTAAYGAGGLAGYTSGTVIVSHSRANATVTSSQGSAGGLLGSISAGVVANSYADGTISGLAAGGVVGTLGGGSVRNVYSVAIIDANAGSRGGVIARDWSGQPEVRDVYWDTERSGVDTSEAGGTGLTTSQLQTATAFDNWNTNIDWTFAAGADPVLKSAPMPRVLSVTPSTLSRLGGETLTLQVENLLPGATLLMLEDHLCDEATVVVEDDTFTCTTLAGSREQEDFHVINADMHRSPLHSLTRVASGRTDLFAGGDGSEADPWIIETPAQFVALHDNAQASNGEQHYVLGADIDLTGVKMGRLRVLQDGNRFVFDGADHTIENFTYDQPTWPYQMRPYHVSGLWLYLPTNAEVHHVTLRDFDVNGTETATLAGTIDGEVHHIDVLDAVVRGNNGSGLCDTLQGSASNIHIEGLLIASIQIGAGVIERLGGSLSDCDVEFASATPSVGGVIGSAAVWAEGAPPARVERCSVSVAHTGTSQFGGIARDAGWPAALVLTDSYAIGNSNAQVIGGMVATTQAPEGTFEVQRCYSAITDNDDVQGVAGGVIGSLQQDAVIAVTETHWDNQVGAPNAIGEATSPPTIDATGHTTAQMQLESTFVNWDFASTWNPPTSDYPTLR